MFQQIGMEFDPLGDRSGLDAELILPEQWGRGARLDAARHPEKRLMLAILEDAIATIGRNAPLNTVTAKHLVEEVEEWYASDDRTWPFSFVSICDHLGFDPDSLRVGLTRWRAARERGTTTRRLRRRASGLRTRLSGRAA